VAEISLDEGVILAGGRVVAFRELEAELLAGGTRADLDALIIQLQARFALIPESRGKKKQGLELLDQAADNLLPATLFHAAIEPAAQGDVLAVGV
jgi:inorganic triphosphatase YgiF